MALKTDAETAVECDKCYPESSAVSHFDAPNLTSKGGTDALY